jgi:hypothetical protein
MHAAGFPGSHVVIRSQEDDIPEETIRDAAALSAKYSKAPQKGKVGVNLVRCRQVRRFFPPLFRLLLFMLDAIAVIDVSAAIRPSSPAPHNGI